MTEEDTRGVVLSVLTTIAPKSNPMTFVTTFCCAIKSILTPWTG